MIVIKIIVVLVGMALSVFLFRKAASTIDIAKINVISYIMYLFLAQTMIGASLVYLGDRNHYTMKYVLQESSFDIMFYSVLLTAILFPLTILVVHRFLHFNMKEAYDGYLKKAVDLQVEKKIFWVVVGLGILSAIFLLIYIKQIGYLPLLKIIRPGDLNMATERQRIGTIHVLNDTLTNLMLGLFIPLLSYVAFAYACAMKKKVKWWITAVALIGISIVAATCDFEKSPVIFYLFVLILIVMYVRGKIPRWIVWGFVGLMALYMIFIYGKNGFDFSGGIDIYNGPIGRTLFTQVGTLAMHFDMFPSVLPFLSGRSFSPTIIKMMGIEGTHIRSGKAVMDFYGSDKVYDGTGGVMNAMFVGEAYANFNYWGMVIAILYVAVFIAFFVYAFLKLRKTPFNIAMFAFLTSRFAQTTQSGFTDFVYNLQFILVILAVIVVNLFPKFWNKFVGPRMEHRNGKKKPEKIQQGGST